MWFPAMSVSFFVFVPIVCVRGALLFFIFIALGGFSPSPGGLVLLAHSLLYSPPLSLLVSFPGVQALFSHALDICLSAHCI